MKTILASFFLFVILTSSGCSVFMAAKQPPRRDPSIIGVGLDRRIMLTEYGLPLSSKKLANGSTEETYQFVDGYSTGVRVSRSVFHGVADLATLCIWEIAGTPIEAIFDGTKCTYIVTFDESEKITQVINMTK